MNAVVEMKQGALAQTQNTGRMAVAEIISHVAMVQEVMAFRIASSYEIEDLSTADTVRYRVTCTGVHQTTGTVLGAGMGEASSAEEKYKWRKAYEPEFNDTPPHLRRKKQGFNKAKKESYSTFQVRTEQADLANTVLKMANKRAHMAMVLSVTAASDCFAQDLEDMDEALRDHLSRHENDTPAQPDQPASPAVWPDEAFDKQLPKLLDAIAKGKPVADLIAWCETKGKLTEAQKAKLQPKADAPAFTFAQVADRISKAGDADAVAIARDLIASIPDGEQRNELHALATARENDIKN
jgi:hypothetical protein